MKKNGFTLIELMAVIVILAIIATITYPIITKSLDNAKKKALESSAYGIMKSADLLYSGDDADISKEYNLNSDDIIYEGKHYEGKLKFNSSSQFAFFFYNDTYCVIKSFTDSKPSIFEVGNSSCNFNFVNGEEIVVNGKNPVVDDANENSLENYQVYGRTNISQLPPQYQQVDYIESDGTQYINTGVSGSSELKVNIAFTASLSSFEYFLFGSRTGYSNADAYSIYLSKNKMWFQYGTPADSAPISAMHSDGNKHIVETIKNQMYFDGKLIAVNTYKSFSSSKNIYLFGLNQNNALEARAFVGKIYGAKIWKGATLLKDYIPCYRKYDNQVGLYDLISGAFFRTTSSSANNFVKGPNTIPSPNYTMPIVSYGDIGDKVSIVSSTTNLLKNTNDLSVSNSANRLTIGYQNSVTTLEKKKEYIHVITPESGNDNNGIAFTFNNMYFYPGESYTFSVDIKGHCIPVSGETCNSSYAVTMKDFFTSISSKTTSDWANTSKSDITSLIKENEWTRLVFSFTVADRISINKRYIVSIGGKSWEFYFRNPQLEYGTTATPYNVNQETVYDISLSEPLRCIENKCDYIDYGIQKVVRKVGKVQFMGSESWNDQYSDFKRFNYFTLDSDKKKSGFENMISNHFFIENSSYSDDHVRGATYEGFEGALLYFPSTSVATSITQWKDWLKAKSDNGEPETVYYELENPKYEDISLPKISTKSNGIIYSNDKYGRVNVNIKYIKNR